MKRITILILFTFLFIGCTVKVTTIPAYELFLGIDLRPFAEKNFLITPYQYNGLYTSIAIIDFKIMPEANLFQVTEGKDAMGYSKTVLKWEIENVRTDDALNGIYKKCSDMGANALVDFKILDTSDEYNKIQVPLEVKGIRITGLAIRRDDLE